MATRSTAARLRRTFQYPTDDGGLDSDSDSLPEAMDEQGNVYFFPTSPHSPHLELHNIPSSNHKRKQLLTSHPPQLVEQESYIKRLAATNKAQNAQMALVLLALPLLAVLPYLPSLLSSSSSLPSLLAITSLASTAYLLRRLPHTVTGILPLDVWSGTGGAAGAASPLDANLPYLNALLALLLSFWGGAVAYKARNFGGGGGGDDDVPQGGPGPGLRAPLAWPIMCNLPAVVYALVLAAKMVMASVDPERELSALRYEYKGA